MEMRNAECGMLNGAKITFSTPNFRLLFLHPLPSLYQSPRARRSTAHIHLPNITLFSPIPSINRRHMLREGLTVDEPAAQIIHLHSRILQSRPDVQHILPRIRINGYSCFFVFLDSLHGCAVIFIQSAILRRNKNIRTCCGYAVQEFIIINPMRHFEP